MAYGHVKRGRVAWHKAKLYLAQLCTPLGGLPYYNNLYHVSFVPCSYATETILWRYIGLYVYTYSLLNVVIKSEDIGHAVRTSEVLPGLYMPTLWSMLAWGSAANDIIKINYVVTFGGEYCTLIVQRFH